jgi:hypothetical protein
VIEKNGENENRQHCREEKGDSRAALNNSGNWIENWLAWAYLD